MIARELTLVYYEIKECYITNKKKEEMAIECIHSNPIAYFSYAKSHSHVKSTIGTLINRQGDLINKPEEMSDILQEQFTSVFSNPNCTMIREPNFEVHIEYPLEP